MSKVTQYRKAYTKYQLDSNFSQNAPHSLRKMSPAASSRYNTTRLSYQINHHSIFVFRLVYYSTFLSFRSHRSNKWILMLPPTPLSKYHLLKEPRVFIALRQIHLIQPNISGINFAGRRSNICPLRHGREIFTRLLTNANQITDDVIKAGKYADIFPFFLNLRHAHRAYYPRCFRERVRVFCGFLKK